MTMRRVVRSRSAREIGSALVRLSHRASQIVDVESITIAELRADVTEVDRLLQRLEESLVIEAQRRTHNNLPTSAVVSIAVEVFDLEEEWRQSRQRESEHRREDLANALMRLQSVRADQEIYDQLCREVCRGCGTDRALLAGVSGDSWIALRQFNARINQSKTRPLPEGSRETFADWPIETAVIQDRRTVRVQADADSQIPAPVRHIMRRRSFAVAPISLSDNHSHDVVGLVYAAEPTPDQWSHHPVVPYLDAFAASVGRLLERAALFAHLETQFSYLRKSLSAAEHALTAFDTDVDLVRLVGREQAGPTPAGAAPWTRPRSTFDREFTARERDVMSLLVRGLNNTQIGHELAIANTTVKSHMQNMLRKAGVVNRAELIAQYYGRGLRPV